MRLWFGPWVLGAIVGVLVGASAASAASVTYTFPPDTAIQPFYRWTVPAQVCSATFDLYGAEGSRGSGGAQVTSTIAVTPGATLDVYIGGQGYLGRAGYNGGGSAAGGGVGGGGATDVRDGPGLNDRLLVAGGGGGNGGYGDGTVTGIGGVGALLGQAGTQSARGYYSGGGGGGGTATNGGKGGHHGPPVSEGVWDGQPGRLGFGGAGGVPTFDVGPNVEGGGGGGGLWGGGGGGAGGSGYPGGGGGGGSSLTAGGTVSATSHIGNGEAIITYELSASCTANGRRGPRSISRPAPTQRPGSHGSANASRSRAVTHA